MAPWGLFSGGTSSDVLPLEPNKAGQDTAFEIFIDGALTKIYNEAGGRSKDLRAIREACKKVIGTSIGFEVLLSSRN